MSIAGIALPKSLTEGFGDQTETKKKRLWIVVAVGVVILIIGAIVLNQVSTSAGLPILLIGILTVIVAGYIIYRYSAAGPGGGGSRTAGAKLSLRR